MPRVSPHGSEIQDRGSEESAVKGRLPGCNAYNTMQAAHHRNAVHVAV
jgi:hypothetical protein